ncbi:MAG: hypothetical protein Q4D56_14725 [Bacteroides sp.]|nr:hypothetical protein [Bacteroides sp.]
MKKTIKLNRFLLLLISVCTLSLISCDSVTESLDGDWDPMTWETTVSDIDKIEVSASGATYTFKCTNYQGFWLSYVYVDGTPIYPSDDVHQYVGEWATITIEENVMTVTLSPNESKQSRSLKIDATAGDIFDYFVFTQAGTQE